MKTIEPGTTFDGKYEVEAVLGSGGVGTVYKALETDLNRQVAIKILHIWTSSVGELDSLQRFKREAKVLCQLLHPNILRVYRFGLTEGDVPFLIMEYVNGESLRSLLDKNGPLEYQKAVKIALKLASALEHAHAHGIVHRDLKPENVIVDNSDPNDPIVKLIDFGLCKPEQKTNSTNQRTLTNTGDLLGTALYMSPEQVLGQPVTERSDIYSFALVLFEMIVGHGPFSEGNVAEIMMRRTTEKMPEILSLSPGCGLPQQLDTLLQSCGARDQSQRVQTFTEVIDLLKSVPATAAGAKYRPGAKGVLGLGSKKSMPILIGASVAILGGLAAVGFVMNSGGGSPTATVKLPAEIIASSIAEVKEKVQKGDLKGAEVAARNSTKNDFEQWPASQRADLLYAYFDIFRNAGDHKATQEYLPRFIKTGLPMLFKKKNEPPEWRERVQVVHDYMESDKHVDRNTWRSLNVALTSDGLIKREYQGDQRTKHLLRELELDSALRVWTNPQPTQISDYTKYMCELADGAAKYGLDDLYDRYYKLAKDSAVKHGFKRFEVLAAEAACRHALAHKDLAEAEKQINFSKQTLKELDAMPDTKELKASSRGGFHKLENEVEIALMNDAQAKGDAAGALRHKELALKASAEYAKFDKVANGSKPSLKAMVIGQFDKNHPDEAPEEEN